MNRAVTLLALALLAAGCTDEASGPAARGGEAAGEVLGGTISDAMIPLEQLESQAPLAPRVGTVPTDLDAEQPDLTEAGAPVEAAPNNTGAEAAPAAPAPAE